MAKQTKKKSVKSSWKAEDFCYEPWHPSMDKPLTKKQQKAIDDEDQQFFEYLKSLGEKIETNKQTFSEQSSKKSHKKDKPCNKKCTTN